MGLRVATANDWAAMTGLPVPGHWIGMAYEEAGTVVGVGGAYEGVDGRWWASVMTRRRRPFALYKAAREILQTAADARVPLYAIPNEQIDGALAFLVRLGFEPTDEIHGGHRVYRWTL